MFVISQNKKFSINASSISRFHLDENHAVYAYCADSDESLLLGEYQTADRALDAMVEITNSIEDGVTYQMPADDAVGTTNKPNAATKAVEPAEAVEPQVDVADVPGEEPAATDDVTPAQPKKRGRPTSGKFILFCNLYPGYLRGEYRTTDMAKEIGCSLATVRNYLRKMQELVELYTASDSE